MLKLNTGKQYKIKERVSVPQEHDAPSYLEGYLEGRRAGIKEAEDFFGNIIYLLTQERKPSSRNGV